MQKGRRDHPAHHRGHQRREQKENQENAEKEAHLKIRNEKMDSIVPVAERKARRECVGTGGGRQVRFAAGEESPHGQKPMLPVLAGKVGELKMTSCERSEHSITSGRARLRAGTFSPPGTGRRRRRRRWTGRSGR